MTTEQALIELKEKQNTVIILNAITSISQNGHGHVCPVCGGGEHKGSTLQYDPNTKCLHCFKCNTHGDIVEFYKQAKSVDFTTALNDCCKIVGIDVEQLAPTANKVATPTPTPTPQTVPPTPPTTATNIVDVGQCANKLSADIVADYLGENKNVYLSSRGIVEKLAEYYGATVTNDNDVLVKKGFKTSADQRTRVAISGAIVFECNNGTCARLCDSGEKPHIKKAGGGDYLFNVKNANNNGKPLFICESPLDALTLLQYATMFNLNLNACAICGVSNYRTFVNYAKKEKLKPPCIVAFDNDGAGREYTDKLKKELLANGFFVGTVNAEFYGKFKDFNEFAVNDPISFLNALKGLKIEIKQKTPTINANRIGEQMPKLLATFKNEPLQFIATPFEPLNELLHGGFKCGFTYVMGGATGIGKTALLTQIAERASIDGHPVFYYSLEIMAPDFLARLISKNTAEIELQENGNTKNATIQFAVENQATTPLTGKQLSTYNRAVERVNRYGNNLYLFNTVDNFNVNTITQQLGEWLEMNANTAPPLLIVDYLQLLKCGDSKTDADQRARVGECQKTLNNFCKHNGITILYASSLNRASTLNNDNITINSFKENGDIEYNNDGALLLTVDAVDEYDHTSTQTLHVVKGRGAEQGKVNLINYYLFNYYAVDELNTY